MTIPANASAVLLEVEPIADGLNDPPFTTVTATLEAQAGIIVAGGQANVNITEPSTLGNVTVSGSGGSATATDANAVDLYLPDPTSGSQKITISGPPANFHILWSVTGSNNSSSGMIPNFGLGNPTVTVSPWLTNYDFKATVGVDKNGNGVLDANEVQRTINVHLVQEKLDLLADTNRDGSITSADEQGKTTWVDGTGKPGALVLPNSDDDNGGPAPDNWPGGFWAGQFRPANTSIDGNGDVKDIAPLQVAMLGAGPLPANLVITMSVAKPKPEGDFFQNIDSNQRIRIFLPTEQNGQNITFQAGDNEIIGPKMGPSVQFVQNPQGNQQSYNIFRGTGNITFGMEGIEAGSEVAITISATLNGVEVGNDVVRVRVSPFVLNNQTNNIVTGQPEKTVFVNKTADPALVQSLTTDFGQNLALDPSNPNFPNFEEWDQDGSEIGYAQAPYGQMPVVLELPRAADRGKQLQQFIEGTMLQPNVAVIRPFGLLPPTTNGLDDGGNIESIPNPSGGPGYVVFGQDILDPVKQFFIAQGVNPIVKQQPVNGKQTEGINTNWLSVGHVDELMSLSPDGTQLIVADPDLALGLLLWADELDKNSLMLKGMLSLYGWARGTMPNGTSVDQVVMANLIDNSMSLEKYNAGIVMPQINSTLAPLEAAMNVSDPLNHPATPGADNIDTASLARGGAFVGFFPDKNPRTYTITFIDGQGDYDLEWREAGGQDVYGGSGNTEHNEVFAPVDGTGSKAYAYILSQWWGNGAKPVMGDTFTYTADPNSKVVEMPVLYYPSANPKAPGALEVTSNFVNSLINGNTVITGLAWGPNVNWSGNGASDILQDYSTAAFNLAGIQNVIAVDARQYANLAGFVHCATNVIRIIPGGKNWWEI